MRSPKKTYLLFGPRVSEETRAAIREHMQLEEIPASFGPFGSGAVHCELFPFLKNERKGSTQEECAARLKCHRDQLRDSHVIVIESTGEQPHVADSIERVRSAAATLKRNGVGEITVAMPSAAYDRQDRGFEEQGRLCSVNAEWFARDLKSRGVDSIITCTPHSRDTMKYWEAAFGKGNYHSIDTTPLFVADIRNAFPNIDNVMVGAPDGADKPNDNGQRRARELAAALHNKSIEEVDSELFKIGKGHVEASETEVTSFSGDVTGKDCVIVDDMADGGSTLVNAARELKKRGARSVSAYITHPICSEKDDAYRAAKTSVETLVNQMVAEGIADPRTDQMLEMLNGIIADHEARSHDTYTRSIDRLMQRDEQGAPLIDRLVTTDSIPEIQTKKNSLPEQDQARVSVLSVGQLLATEIEQILSQHQNHTRHIIKQDRKIG